MKLVLLLIYAIIGIESHLSGDNYNYTCIGWSDWLDFKEFSDNLFLNYRELQISDAHKSTIKESFDGSYRGDMCDLFNLKTYVRETKDKKKFYGLGVVKTAGIASLLGLTFAIVGTFVYSKSRQNKNSSPEEEEPLLAPGATN